MKIAIGCDHSAIELKKEIVKYLEELGHNITDFGTHTSDSVDYAIYGKKVADEIASGKYDRGILICSSGIGISIAANKVKGIRCGVRL